MTDSDISAMMKRASSLRQELDGLQENVLEIIRRRVLESIADVADVRELSVYFDETWTDGALGDWTESSVTLDFSGSFGRVIPDNEFLVWGADFTVNGNPSDIVAETLHSLRRNQLVWAKLMDADWPQVRVGLEHFYMRCEAWLKVNYACDELKIWVFPNESSFPVEDGGTGTADSFNLLFKYRLGEECRLRTRRIPIFMLSPARLNDGSPFGSGLLDTVLS